MEGDLVRRESDVPFHPIAAAAVRGRGLFSLLKNTLTLLRGVVQAVRLLRAERPLAVFGTGGYVCVPLFVAAWILGVPRAIFLPDVVPGMAVKALARFATVVIASIPDAAPFLGLEPLDAAAYTPGVRRLVITGYPVRPAVHATPRPHARALFAVADETPIVLIYGGSRGARSLNHAIRDALPTLLPQMHVVHVCGREGDEPVLRAAAQRLDPALQRRYHLFPYLAADGPVTMTAAFAAADFTVCRSGASVLGELPAAQLPAILVPYPFVHQDENADYLVRHGAASKIADGQIATALVPAIQALATDPARRAAMRQSAAAIARPHAAHAIATVVLRIGGITPQPAAKEV